LVRLIQFTVLLDRRMLHCLLLVAVVVRADNPFDWPPSVSLPANLEEPEGLGFCIDIAVFGASLVNCAGSLQAHSCKQAGTYTQFEYIEKSLQVVNYDAACGVSADSGTVCACVQVSGEIAEGASLTLAECNDSQKQTFGLVNNELRVGSGSMCLVASTTLQQAGRFVARDLFLSGCATTSGEHKEWTITPTPGGILICFPGSAKVDHREKEWTSLEEVVVGDHVLVDDKGTY
jgi:hypothetical protein